MTGSTRGRRLLVAQADRNPPLDPPPEWMPAPAVQAWHDICAACPAVLRRPDSMYLSVVAMTLCEARRSVAAGALERERLRLVYRMLGDQFVPMAARRRLIFGASIAPSRSRRV